MISHKTMQTIVLKYKTDDENISLIRDYRRQYSNILHCAYNRAKEDINEKSITEKVSNLNNVPLMECFFIRSAVKEAISMVKSTDDATIIFGGKNNFIKRCQGKISQEEYRNNRLSSLYSMGESNQKGNRKFQILSDGNSILFKPNRNTHINLEITGSFKKYRQLLQKLYVLQEAKMIPITYKLDDKFIYVSFDETSVNKIREYKQIDNRVFSVDLNPNYVGWSVVDWKSSSDFKVISSGVISIKDINDKEFSLKKSKKNPNGYSSDHPKMIYLNNKRKHEVFEISKHLVNLAVHYQCSIFSMEDLKIESSDKGKGKKFNSLCNKMWNRQKMINNIQKRCNIYHIDLQKVKANYSSFVGNFLFRELRLPDMVLASIEIGRRGYEFYNQYITKTKEKKKNIVFPDTEDFAVRYVKSLEEFGICGEVKDLKEAYEFLKKSGCRYRLSIDDCIDWFSSCFSSASKVRKLYGNYSIDL